MSRKVLQKDKASRESIEDDANATELVDFAPFQQKEEEIEIIDREESEEEQDRDLKTPVERFLERLRPASPATTTSTLLKERTRTKIIQRSPILYNYIQN